MRWSKRAENFGDRVATVLRAACTAAVSRTAADAAEASGALASATLLANAVLFPRAFLIVFVISPALAKVSLPMLNAMTLTGVLTSRLFNQSRAWSSAAREFSPVFRNPFTIGPALRLSVVFTIVLFITRAGHQLLGNNAQLITSGVAGLIDVDAFLLPLAESVRAGGSSYRHGLAMRPIICL
jgi:uncharacterized membrane protein (DUF4010 family)